MATPALAQETILSLRREIARIEGTLAERLEASEAGVDDSVLLRRNGVASARAVLPIGIRRFDACLQGGLPLVGLTEIHGLETRDAGAVAGFTLALLSLRARTSPAPAPFLWIGTAEIFREAGPPYVLGLQQRFGIPPDALLVSQTGKLADVLWIAEEAARHSILSAVILEVRGNAQKLDLTATRRLHLRAQEAGHPIFLLRQSAQPEPTAAAVRLIVEATPAGQRKTIAGLFPHSIGPPGFAVTVDKNRFSPSARFLLEWNSDDRAFVERQNPANSVALVSPPRRREIVARVAGKILAFPAGNFASGHQPSGGQHPTHRRSG